MKQPMMDKKLQELEKAEAEAEAAWDEANIALRDYKATGGTT